MSETIQTPAGLITISDRYYLASCDGCGWIGSSGDCGADYWGDDSDVYCPKCFKSGADCGKVASEIEDKRRREKIRARENI